MQIIVPFDFIYITENAKNWRKAINDFEDRSGIYRISGEVDAENSYGAKMRGDFVCILNYRSGDYDKIFCYMPE